jgi:hypothetical protein
VDFDENKNQSKAENRTKNRKTLVLLFVMFVTPVALAYAAYFGQWFSGASGAQGALMESGQITDIEDYNIVDQGGQKISGKDFETLYWWVIPIQPEQCDQNCLNLNLNMVNQTYVGLGKEALRVNQLAILPKDSTLDFGSFPTGISEFSNTGVKALEKTHSGKNIDLEANAIYLVDPLGNIFMKYPLVTDEKEAPLRSRQLRKDLLHLFKYSRLG